jgi:hypothetical protein
MLTSAASIVEALPREQDLLDIVASVVEVIFV